MSNAYNMKDVSQKTLSKRETCISYEQMRVGSVTLQTYFRVWSAIIACCITTIKRLEKQSSEIGKVTRMGILSLPTSFIKEYRNSSRRANSAPFTGRSLAFKLHESLKERRLLINRILHMSRSSWINWERNDLWTNFSCISLIQLFFSIQTYFV